MSLTPTDFTGRPLAVGQTVARAARYGSSSAYLERRTVERIEKGKVYLNGAGGSALRGTMGVVIIAEP